MKLNKIMSYGEGQYSFWLSREIKRHMDSSSYLENTVYCAKRGGMSLEDFRHELCKYSMSFANVNLCDFEFALREL